MTAVEFKRAIAKDAAYRIVTLPKGERFALYEQLAREGYTVKITLMPDKVSKDGVKESVFIDYPGDQPQPDGGALAAGDQQEDQNGHRP